MNDTGQDTEEKSPISSVRLKEYGMKAYEPIISVVFKYQDEITPYFRAIQNGLRGGADALKQENSSSEDRYVAGFFHDAAEGLEQALKKLEARDPKAFSDYVSDLSGKRPSLMFSTSYIAGLFFGRLSRHFARHQVHSSAQKPEMTNEPPSFDQSIH